MPLTPSGKVARRCLPQPTVDDIAADGTNDARDEIELRMTRVWSNILEQDKSLKWLLEEIRIGSARL